jgi:hypothetical protein
VGEQESEEKGPQQFDVTGVEEAFEGVKELLQGRWQSSADHVWLSV